LPDAVFKASLINDLSRVVNMYWEILSKNEKHDDEKVKETTIASTPLFK